MALTRPLATGAEHMRRCSATWEKRIAESDGCAPRGSSPLSRTKRDERDCDDGDHGIA